MAICSYSKPMTSAVSVLKRIRSLTSLYTISIYVVSIPHKNKTLRRISPKIYDLCSASRMLQNDLRHHIIVVNAPRSKLLAELDLFPADKRYTNHFRRSFFNIGLPDIYTRYQIQIDYREGLTEDPWYSTTAYSEYLLWAPK